MARNRDISTSLGLIGLPCETRSQQRALQSARDKLAKLPKLRKMQEFVAMIARMTTEEEMQDGGTSEDYIATVNQLIGEARRLTGIDPKHPKVYCVSCGTNVEGGCVCDV